MMDIGAKYDELERNFVAFANDEPTIRTAIVLGSRARSDHPADEWSDLDIVLFSTDPGRYLDKDDWLKNIGEPVMSFLQATPMPGGMEHRVLFEGGYDVDFVIVPVDRYEEIANHPQAPFIFYRGIRFIVDKDGVESRISFDCTPPREKPPEEKEFLNLIKDFWYHAIWTAKKLRRGELFTAKSCLDMHMKWRLLLTMIRWHSLAANGWDTDIWHEGRYLEEWADALAVEGLRAAFAHYDEDDMWRALFASMDLFRWLSVETAGKLEYPYPKNADEQTTKIVEEIAPG